MGDVENAGWNKSGTLYAGADKNWIWIADARVAKVIRRTRVPKDMFGETFWESDRKLSVRAVGKSGQFRELGVWRL